MLSKILIDCSILMRNVWLESSVIEIPNYMTFIEPLYCNRPNIIYLIMEMIYITVN